MQPAAVYLLLDVPTRNVAFSLESVFGRERQLMHFDLVTIRVFVAVAEELSIAASARRENIVASAISKRIRNLETEVGVRLFRRHRSGVQTTPAGQALYRHCREMLAALDRAESDMCLFAGAVKGCIKLAVTTSAAIQSLPDELNVFLQRYPAVQIELLEMPSHCVVRAVRDGSADIGIYSTMVPAQGVTSHPYRRDHLAVLVPEGHSLASERKVFFAQTLKFRHVCLNSESPLHAFLEQKAHEAGRTLQVMLSATSFDAVRRLVQSGFGIGILPEMCILPYTKALGVRSIRLADAWATRDLRLCAKPTPPSPVARLFFEHLSSQAATNFSDQLALPPASSKRGVHEMASAAIQPASKSAEIA
jgi:DNA-binding transcriptional LysR family regulator